MSKVILKSSDGQIFTVEQEVAYQSVTIKTMLHDLGFHDHDDEEPVPLPNVRGVILEKIIQWAKHHVNDNPSGEEECAEKRSDDISNWDKKFLDVDNNILFEIILAANYLDIKPLLDMSCKTVANMIKGKTPEEIRNTFKVDPRANLKPERPECPIGESPPGKKMAVELDDKKLSMEVDDKIGLIEAADKENVMQMNRLQAAKEA